MSVVAGLAVVQGWRIAQAAAHHPHSAASTAIPLTALYGTLLGFVAAGLAPQLLSSSTRAAASLAAVLAGVLAATVAIATLWYPTGVADVAMVRH